MNRKNINLLRFTNDRCHGNIHNIRRDDVYNEIKHSRVTIERNLCFAYVLGHYDLVDIIIKKYCRDGMKHLVIVDLIMHGYNVDLIHYLTYNIKNRNKYFIYACMNNNISAAVYFIKNGITNLNKGFRTACIKGHVILMAVLLGHGATDLTFFCLKSKIHPFIGYTWQMNHKESWSDSEQNDYVIAQRAFCRFYINNFDISLYDINITDIIREYL